MPRKSERPMKLPAIQPQDQMATFANLMALAAVRSVKSDSNDEGLNSLVVSQEISVNHGKIELYSIEPECTKTAQQPGLFEEN